jgi:hypothetical protein
VEKEFVRYLFLGGENILISGINTPSLRGLIYNHGSKETEEGDDSSIGLSVQSAYGRHHLPRRPYHIA